MYIFCTVNVQYLHPYFNKNNPVEDKWTYK